MVVKIRNKCVIFENDTSLLFLSRLSSTVPPLQGQGEKTYLSRH